ncbi:MAG: hypothetical protein AB8B51_07085 [Sedimentitalea sp.]
MSLRRLIGVLGVLAVLAGCEDTLSTQSASQSSVRPGTSVVDGVIAATMFSSICIEAVPNFTQLPARLNTAAFKQNPETGTYYHQKLDLSVRFNKRGGSEDGSCSMVFGSRDKAGEIALLVSSAALRKGASKPNATLALNPNTNSASTKLIGGSEFLFNPVQRHNGRGYYRAIVQASK